MCRSRQCICVCEAYSSYTSFSVIDDRPTTRRRIYGNMISYEKPRAAINTRIIHFLFANFNLILILVIFTPILFFIIFKYSFFFYFFFLLPLVVSYPYVMDFGILKKYPIIPSFFGYMRSGKFSMHADTYHRFMKAQEEKNEKKIRDDDCTLASYIIFIF